LSYFHHAITQLIEQVTDANEGQIRCEQRVDSSSVFSFIDWLDAQPLFPKFYWQSRDQREEVVALGQLHTFLEPAPAYQILGDKQRVWGGRSFDGGSDKNPRCMPSFFFLPKIELIRLDQQWTLAANIDGDRQRTLQALRKLVVDIPKLAGLCTEVKQLTHTPSKQQWCRVVDYALREIAQHQFKKVVLARQTKLILDSVISAAQLLKASRGQNHHSFHFLMAIDSKHGFIGSTPERLYFRQGSTLYTEALAGTIGRGDNATDDMALSNWLAQDSKNLNENSYVVDDIIERLHSCSEQIVVDQDVGLVRLRKVQHLKRNIQAELKQGINGVQLLAALQPTAAVAGLPRAEALKFIANNELFSRGWYAGSMGYISHQQAEFCVAIRSALIVGEQVNLYAGAGIVPGSVAEHEWAELDKKVSTLLTLITDRLHLGVAS
jgi:menaquinone-specific isochorismate synthase